MKKIMYEIAGIALLCSTCIGTVNAASDDTEEMELEDLDLQNSVVDKTNAGVKGVQELGKKLMETSKKKPEVKDEDEPSEESKVKDETNESEVKKDEAQKTEKLTKEETKDEAQKTEELIKEETKDEAQKTEELTTDEINDKTPKTEELTTDEINDKTPKTEKTLDEKETHKVKVLAEGLAAASESETLANAMADKIIDKALEKREANEQQQDLGLADMFGDDSSTQTSNEQSSGAVLPSISEKDLSRDIANEFDEALKSYLEQQKKLSELQENLSEQYNKLSNELSKLPEGSTTQSKIAKIHKSLTNTRCDLSELKSELSQWDEKFNDEKLDHSKFEEIWKNLDAQQKLLDDQLDARSKLSNEVGQFAVKLGGLKKILTRIDKLLEDLGVVKDALTEINKTDYSELFNVAKSRWPNIYNEQQKELEKTRTLWKNHESAVLIVGAKETAKARRAHDKAMQELVALEKKSKTPFDESAITGLSEVAEQARIELDVLDLSKDNFVNSKVLGANDWSSYADKFNDNEVEIPNNKKDLAGKIKSLLDDFIALKASIESQVATEVSEEDQNKGIEMMNKLKKYLSSLRKLGISSEDKSIIRQKRLAASAENLAELVDKAMKTINTSKLALKSLNKSFVDFAYYEHEFDAKKETPEGQKKLMDDVKTKLTAFESWFESIKKQNPSIVSKEDKKAGLATAKDLANALSELIENVKSTISEPKAEVSKTESDTEGKVDDSAAQEEPLVKNSEQKEVSNETLKKVLKNKELNKKEKNKKKVKKQKVKSNQA